MTSLTIVDTSMKGPLTRHQLHPVAMSGLRIQTPRPNALKINSGIHCNSLRIASRLRGANTMASASVRPAPVSKVQQALGAFFGFSMAMTIFALPSVAQEVFSGLPRIVDGDTIVVSDIRVRLFGIDAPESKQSCKNAGGAGYTCGIEAAEKLKAKVADSSVRCVQQTKDQYGRSVAVCSTPTFEINEWMVRQGYAVAYRQYGGQVYAAAEDEARIAKRGIWSGEFDVPSDWRKAQKIEQLEKGLGRKQPPEQQEKDKQKEREAEELALQQAQQRCQTIVIKGNISSSGEKIYHKPGDRSYTTTRIETLKGERYFCSEEEAVKAGWRASK